jgi:hypothetical protein
LSIIEEEDLMAKRLKGKRSIVSSILLSPITIPIKMTNSILKTSAIIGLIGLGAICGAAKDSNKGWALSSRRSKRF